MDTIGLRWSSGGVSREPRHAAPLALVWSTRLHGDRLRDLRAISRVGTDDNMGQRITENQIKRVVESLSPALISGVRGIPT